MNGGIIFMLDKKKFIFFSFLFFIVFTIIGDAYIYFLDSKIFESDFKFVKRIENEKSKQEYLNVLEKLSKEVNVKIYVVTSTVTSKNSATYTIFSSEENKDFLKKRIFVQNDISVFHSLISGNRKVIFKPFSDFETNNNNDVNFYVFGSKDNVELLRSKTIDKYGMSKPEENKYPNDALFTIISAWIFVFFVIFLYITLEVNSLKKEVLIKFFNGSDKKDTVIPMIFTNSLTIVSSALLGMLLAALITESSKFLLITIVSILFIILTTNLLYLILLNLDIKKTFVKSYYTLGYKMLTFTTLFFVTMTLIISLTLNFKTMYDAFLTINQENDWKKFYSYDNIYFSFKELTDTTNYDTDRKHIINFYNKNLNKYKIHLSFDFSNNGGVASHEIDTNETFIYLNKHAKKIIKHLDIELDNLLENRFYIISRYTDKELKEKGIFDSTSSNEIHYLLESNEGIFETIHINHPYKILVYDINMTNLADNYKKNPIILLDTHNKFPSNLSSEYIFNSLVKFEHDNDFEKFINEIGYENEIFYKNNVKELFLEKRTEKLLILLINIILSVMLIFLFNFSLSTILKMDFKSRAIEISLNKIFGKTFFQRYKSLFWLLISAFTSGVLISFLGKFIFYQFYIHFIFISSTFVFINTTLILLFYIKKYEKINIPRILNGGV